MPIRKHLRRIALALVACALVGPAFAGFRTVSWNPSSGASGYKIHYGTSPNSYSSVVDVGNVTQATIQQDLDDCTTWYFAVTAYNSLGESDFSSEVPWLTPMSVDSASPVGSSTIRQGSQFTMNIDGAGFQPGATVSVDTSGWSDCNGSAACQALRDTVRLENPSINCNRIQVAATVEPTGSAGRPAQAGVYSITITNPDNSSDSRSNAFTVEIDEARFDVDPDEDGTLDVKDLTANGRMFGSCDPNRFGSGACPGGDPSYDEALDFNGDGWVDGDDLAHICSNFGLDWSSGQQQWVCPGASCVHF